MRAGSGKANGLAVQVLHAGHWASDLGEPEDFGRTGRGLVRDVNDLQIKRRHVALHPTEGERQERAIGFRTMFSLRDLHRCVPKNMSMTPVMLCSRQFGRDDTHRQVFT
jgi:hypothetical protein